MNSFGKLLLLATLVTPLACQHAEQSNAERAATASAVVTHVIVFHNQDARTAVNHARKEFGIPPMTGEVRVQPDLKANTWVVEANAHDMARVEAIAARYDQPGVPIWKQ